MSTDVKTTLAGQLAAFQAELPKVTKGSINEHFKSKYADLDDVTSVVVPLLAKHGLTWTCTPTMEDEHFTLKYLLIHSISGEKIGGRYPLPDPSDVGPQAIGSAITYARRYALLAVTGVTAGDDDDGNAAQSTAQSSKNPSKDWDAVLDEAYSTEDLEALKKMWGTHRMSRAPKKVVEAFMARVKELQDVKEQPVEDESHE